MLLANPNLKKSLPRVVAGNKYWLAIVIALIPIIGLILELISEDLPFQRSGAVLVCVAIYGVYLNHFVQKDNDLKLRIHKQYLGFNSKEDYAKALMRSNADSVIPDEALEREAERGWEDKEKSFDDHKRLNVVSKNIIQLELICGIIGTLIWAFGDLPFK